MDFRVLEDEARDLVNFKILDICAGRWVRNKDIAEAVGLTPAGAKRRNENLENLELLERRRFGKEVRTCATAIAYVANLDLAGRHRLESMAVTNMYLNSTMEYSRRILHEAGAPNQLLEETIEKSLELVSCQAYLWPADVLGQMLLSIPGFNRPGTRILDLNTLTVPLPRMTIEEYRVYRNKTEEYLSANAAPGKRLVVTDLDEMILESLLTGRAKVVDYDQQKEEIERNYHADQKRAAQHFTILVRFRRALASMRQRGPLSFVIDGKIQAIIEHLSRLGLGPTDIPRPVIGKTSVDPFPSFSEEAYEQLRNLSLGAI